ncbi:YfiR family protein [Methylotenera sp.]|uniref:YfiR family protein n=1 Tax=Methylotenera sp. TaxID=2051956 RepID=UPI0024874819|nr:YfiR family protein [Methylotenera sp.]MDI1362475.1 YfiR family protein [Methylotenera sp.]
MKIKPLIYKCFIASLLGLPLVQSCQADPAPEYKLKAAFIYNFILLTEWPKTVNDSLRVCVIGKSAMDDAINEIDGTEANKRYIRIIRLQNFSNIEACEVLYLGDTDPLDIKNILNKLGELPVLTVSDNVDLVKSGVMINMFPDNRRLVFNVNVESAKHAHLTLSSRLVRLAK